MDIIDDVSKLTTIPRSNITELFDYFSLAMCHQLLEAKREEKDTVSMNIGTGILTIKLDDYSLKMKFTPSKKLSSMMENTLKTSESPLVKVSETKLRDKFLSVYKELI